MSYGLCYEAVKNIKKNNDAETVQSRILVSISIYLLFFIYEPTGFVVFCCCGRVFHRHHLLPTIFPDLLLATALSLNKQRERELKEPKPTHAFYNMYFCCTNLYQLIALK